MIFSVEGHILKIIGGEKLQTRRASDKYQVGKLYSVQPNRGAEGIPDGKIYIGQKIREWKPDLSDLPGNATLSRRWLEMEANYPIRDFNAKEEGGYTPEEYEELYEKMHPAWTERWAYWFAFFTTAQIEEAQRHDAENKRK